MPKEIITKSFQETKSVARKLTSEWLKLNKNKNANLVFCLSGNLGGGKTTFTQGVAEELKIKETVNSPTFLIVKKYTAPKNKITEEKYNLYHFDCYRISNYREILDLGWEEIISGKNNIIAIEWSEKIKTILPKKRMDVKFEFVNEGTRKIIIGP